MNPNTTLINTIKPLINEPISSEFVPSNSIIPEWLRSISMPISIPLISDELNSISQPLNVIIEEEEIVNED